MKKKITRYVIIGLGRFGQAVAKELAENTSYEILAIDENEDAVNSVKEFVTLAVAADATDENVMQQIGIRNFDAAIICIADNMEASIMSALICKQSGIEYVAAKAKNLKHKSVLEKLGVDTVVIPEYEMGKKLAHKLAYPAISDMFEIGNDFRIVEAIVPEVWSDKTLMELRIRKLYDVNVLFLRRGAEMITNMSGDTKLKANDLIAVAGYITDIDKFLNKIETFKNSK